MIKRIVLASIVALAATAHADPIHLASLASVDGKILVNQGRGFVAAKPGMVLSDGDRVIALDGSRAAVVYPDGCVTQLKENSLLAMDKGAGCNKEPVRTGGGSEQPLRVAQAIGGPEPKPVVPNGPGVVIPSATAGGLSHTPLLLFGALATGGMIADTHRNATPISPQ